MVAARSLLLAFVALGASLTGCIGNDGGPEPDIESNETGPTASQTLLAFEETNATEEGVGGVDHHHDMWNGQTRMLIFETHAAMAPGAGPEGTSATFRPPLGSLIFEGTATIEFTMLNPQRRACEPFFTLDGDFVCTDAATPLPDPTGGSSGLKLRYKHASTTTWIDVGDIVWAAPTIIKITDARHTDMPHATSSLWEFQVVSPNAYDGTLSFDAKAEAVRSEGEIPLWPGHPAFYADKCCREVLNVPDATACDSGTSQTGCILAGDNAGFLTADKLVSYGTRTLHVWVNITDAQMTNPATAPVNWFLFHLNATGLDNITNPFDDAYTIDKRELYWILPVDDNGMDSPYADGSRWTFQLGASIKVPPENPVRDGLACFGGCAEWSATYSIVVHATDEALPFDTYHHACLRDADCAYTEGAA